jgi:hypothetical protein
MRKDTDKLQIPPPAKDGIKTRFEAVDEHHLREEARRAGFPNVQSYIRELARRDRIAKQPRRKP